MAKGKTTPIAGGKKVKLKLLERILLTGIIIQRGNKADIIVAKDVMGKIELTQRELKDYGVKFANGRVYINAVGSAKTFDIHFTDMEIDVVKKSFKEADTNGEFTQPLLDLEPLFE